MNIPLPDKIYKLIFLIGVILFSIMLFKPELLGEELDLKRDRLVIQAINLQNKREQKIYQIKQKAFDLSIKYHVQNFLEIKKNSISLSYKDKMSKNEQTVRDLLLPDFNEIDDLIFQSDALLKEINSYDKILNDQLIKPQVFRLIIAILSGLFIVAGVVLWNQSERENIENVRYSRCQSCAKNFSGVREYGHYANGNLNYSLCIECYDNGVFKNPSLTIDDVTNEIINRKPKLEKSKQKLKSKLQKLLRWKNDEYGNI